MGSRSKRILSPGKTAIYPSQPSGSEHVERIHEGCSGSGAQDRCKDRAPVADVLADAETLRLFAQAVLYDGWPVQSDRAWTACVEILAAGRAGLQVHVPFDREAMAAGAAYLAARHAFNGVPALRGEA